MLIDENGFPIYESIEELIVATAAMVRPPERLTVAEAAARYRKLNNPGAFVGPWNNDTAPYLIEPMEELTSKQFTGMIFVGPAQTGKTDMVMNWVGHTAICNPSDMMIIQTSQSSARDFYKRRIDRLFRHSPEIGAKVAPGRNMRNTFDTRFTAGWMLTLSWPTINELSGKPVQYLWLTDYDRMDQDINHEGSPYSLAKKRATTFKRNGMTVAESSPGFTIEDPKWKPSKKEPHEAPPTTGILALYNSGDRRRWMWQCPHCVEAFEPDFSLLSWTDKPDLMDAADTAFMGCPHCGGVIEHDEDKERGIPGKYQLNIKGRWIKEGETWNADGTITGRGRRSDTASFWMKGPAAAFTDWRGLVFNYLKAMEDFEKTGSEEALKTTINTDQGLPYLPKGTESDRLPENYKARATDLGERVVPRGVRFLIATVDVQKNRFVCQVQGYGVGGDITIIDRFELKKSDRFDDDGDRLHLNPGAYAEDWDILIPEVIEKTYPLDDGSDRVMQVRATGCDSGGKEGVTKNAYDFWRRLRDHEDGDGHHRRFQLIKGASQKTAPRTKLSYPDSDRTDRHAGARGEIPVLFINTNQIKDQVFNKLEREEPGMGSVSFPEWLPDWFYNELTAERRTEKGWENPRKVRNEAWDLLVYAEAVTLSRIVKIETLNWDNPPGWAEDWDDNDFVSEPTKIKRFAEKKKSDYDLGELANMMA